jgi:hypothetical protein
MFDIQRKLLYKVTRVKWSPSISVEEQSDIFPYRYRTLTRHLPALDMELAQFCISRRYYVVVIVYAVLCQRADDVITVCKERLLLMIDAKWTSFAIERA